MAVMTVARLGVARLGAFRLNGFVQPSNPSLPGVAWVKVLINGVDRGSGTFVDGMTITDELNHAPNNASFRCRGFTPVVGHEVKIYLGDTDVAHQLFGGHILSLEQGFEGKPAAPNVYWSVHCIDYTWLLDRRPVIKKYTSQSATAIVVDLIASFTAGVTTANVAPGLASLDEITFTNEEVSDALTRITERIGGYWYLDYAKDLHVFLTETETAHAVVDGDVSASDVSQDADLSQIATRVTARGGGSTTATDIAVGSTTLPLEDAADTWYASGAGVVECGPQRITYTGKASTTGVGSIVAGQAISAPSAPTATVSATAGNLSGVYSYVTTFVVGGGESTPSSASGSVTAGNTVPDASAMTITASDINLGVTMLPPGTVVRFKVAYVNASGEGPTGTPTPPFTITSVGEVQVGAGGAGTIPIGPGGTTARRIYRSDNGGPYGLVRHIGNNTASNDITCNDVLGAAPRDAGSQVDLTSIATGPAGTTARRLYRTTAGGAVYKRVTTISDNSTTTFTDNVADGSLGDEAPTVSSVSGLAADTTLQVAELSVFPASGWVQVGSQLLRYTGRSGSSGPGTLTGIPASGIGAILSPIAVDAEVITAPHLTGVSGVLYAINKGEPVNLIVTVNNVPAQTAMAAAVGGSGIHEMFITDGRWSIVEATARATAELTQRKDPLVTKSLVSRDQTIQSGRTITFSLTNPAITGTAKIQRVTITEIGIFGPQGTTLPLRTVELSSRQYSFEDLLRNIRGRASASTD